MRTPTFALLLIIALARPGRAQPNPPRAQIIEELRLDAEKADFTRISRVEVGPHGFIAVPSLADGIIKIFDSTGAPRRSVGRRGSGPGEFRSITNIGWLADTMWVTDVNQRRVSYFGADGKLIKTASAPAIANKAVVGTPFPQTIAFFLATNVQRDGALAGTAALKPAGTANTRKTDRASYVRVDASGIVRLLMPVPVSGAVDDRYSMSVGGLIHPIPFVTSPEIAYGSALDRIAVLTPLQTSPTGGTISVSLIQTTGDTLFSKTFPYRGEPIPKATRDSAIADMLKVKGEQKEGRSNVGQQLHAIARRKTPYIYSGASFIVLGLDNTVWVGLHATSTGHEVLVFNAKGDAVATVLIPRNTRLRQANARNIWVTETDADGLTSVVRYRVSGILQ